MVIYDGAPAAALIERHEKLAYPHDVEFGGANLRIEKGVFCPTLTNTSPVLLHAIDVQPGERVLDVFSGCGAFGIIAALRGAEAVTIDSSRNAVECAKRNAARNNVASRIDIRLGDVRIISDAGKGGIRRGERFDLVIANPPLLPGEPHGPLSAAIFSPGFDVITAFISSLPSYLSPNGRCFLLTSDVLDRAGLEVTALCSQRGMSASLHATRDVGYERYRVHRIAWPRDADGHHA